MDRVQFSILLDILHIFSETTFPANRRMLQIHLMHWRWHILFLSDTHYTITMLVRRVQAEFTRCMWDVCCMVIHTAWMHVHAETDVSIWTFIWEVAAV